ncbi:hypothetical protein KR093_005970 [Drosophila rubida]|uniref:Ras-related protein Rab-7b n=1 Tax=Drosophila rubida TaxID=30044 RepID=A0AAD4PR49_9MUSC|nr:hypothetical protein KR093_005970 [Drosophila rubida]
MSGRDTRKLKVLLMGDMNVGKSCLTLRYVNKTYAANYKATIVSGFSTNQVVLNNSLVTLQIWDMAGQEQCRTLGPAFYRGADCCILVFDVTDRKSFQNLNSWWDTFFSLADTKNPNQFPIIVVGNKIDLENRQVSKIEAERLCKSFSIPYIECSAKDGTHVKEAFESLATKVVEFQDQDRHVQDEEQHPLNQDEETSVGDGPVSFEVVDQPSEKHNTSKCCICC